MESPRNNEVPRLFRGSHVVVVKESAYRHLSLSTDVNTAQQLDNICSRVQENEDVESSETPRTEKRAGK